MSNKRKEIKQLVEHIDSGGKVPWVRKTTFTPREDGSFDRKVVSNDGTVELEENIPPERCMVLTVRAKTGLSQTQFAALLGISVRTLHDWEQGRRRPSAAARTLIKVAAKHPEVVKEATAIS